MGYRMRFLWPDEIDADQAHYQKLLEKWGSDEAIDDLEHAFGSLFWQMSERVPCVALDAQTGQAARKEGRSAMAAASSARRPGGLRNLRSQVYGLRDRDLRLPTEAGRRLKGCMTSGIGARACAVEWFKRRR